MSRVRCWTSRCLFAVHRWNISLKDKPTHTPLNLTFRRFLLRHLRFGFVQRSMLLGHLFVEFVVLRLEPFLFEYFGRLSFLIGQMAFLLRQNVVGLRLVFRSRSVIGVPSRACEAHLEILSRHVCADEVVARQIVLEQLVDLLGRSRGVGHRFESPMRTDLSLVRLTSEHALLATAYAVELRMLAIVNVRLPPVGLVIEIEIGGKPFFPFVRRSRSCSRHGYPMAGQSTEYLQRERIEWTLVLFKHRHFSHCRSDRLAVQDKTIRARRRTIRENVRDYETSGNRGASRVARARAQWQETDDRGEESGDRCVRD